MKAYTFVTRANQLGAWLARRESPTAPREATHKRRPAEEKRPAYPLGGLPMLARICKARDDHIPSHIGRGSGHSLGRLGIVCTQPATPSNVFVGRKFTSA